MNTIDRSIAVAAAIAVLGQAMGCATQPSNVAAMHVSTLKYESTDCRRLALEYDEVNGRLATTTSSLQTKANTDAALMAVGLIVFWPAMLGLAATGGRAEEQELARLKGEKEALENAGRMKNCGLRDATATPTSAVPTSPDASAITPVVAPAAR